MKKMFRAERQYPEFHRETIRVKLQQGAQKGEVTLENLKRKDRV